LTDPPENGESKGLIASAHASSARPSASRDILLTVSGNRTVMHLVGHVKNGFGMDMAAVETVSVITIIDVVMFTLFDGLVDSARRLQGSRGSRQWCC
jgi:hypothetical protein